MSKAQVKEPIGNDQERVPPSFLISRQLDQEKVDFLTKRIEELLNSNNSLRTSASRNEKDTHDIVLYFQREMEMKDDIISRLNEELVKRETQLKLEVEKMRKKFETDLLTLRNTTDQTISDLAHKLDNAQADLVSVDLYRKERDQNDQQIKQLNKGIQDQRQQMFDALEELERKFLEEKSQFLKELDSQKAAYREVALKEARVAMGEEAKKIMGENNRMFEELKFHHEMTTELQTEKVALQHSLTMAKRDVTILTEKELEYAKQAFFKSKEIKALRDRIEQLEKQHSVNVEKFKHRTKELKSTVSRELEEATLDAVGLRQLLKIKNKELQHMKTLAATIVSQRTETEQFFLESLQEVKEIVKKERKMNQVEAQLMMNKLKSGKGMSDKSTASGLFPALNIKSSNLHHLQQRATCSALPTADLEKVLIKDLTWEDKELVLRVLFARMNAAQSQLTQAVAQTQRNSAPSSSAMPPAVFVSEGANYTDEDDMAEAARLVGTFEVNDEEGEMDDLSDDESAIIDDAEESGRQYINDCIYEGK